VKLWVGVGAIMVACGGQLSPIGHLLIFNVINDGFRLKNFSWQICFRVLWFRTCGLKSEIQWLFQLKHGHFDNQYIRFVSTDFYRFLLLAYFNYYILLNRYMKNTHFYSVKGIVFPSSYCTPKRFKNKCVRQCALNCDSF
jgi:hypothetical protein